MSKDRIVSASSLPPLTIKVDVEDVEYTLCAAKDSQISLEDFEYECANQPSDLAQWLHIREDLADELRRLNKERKKLDAHLTAAFREELAQILDRKPTEKMIADSVLTHEEMQSLDDDILAYQRAHGMVSAGCEALQAKKDMLKTLGRRMGQQNQAPLRVMEQQSRDERTDLAKSVISKSKKKVKKVKKTRKMED